MAATELVDPEDYAKRTAREIVARWMLTNGFATGHGDSLYDLLRELEWQVNELKSRLQAEAPEDAEVAEIENRYEATKKSHALYAKSGRAIQAVSPQFHDDCGTLLTKLRARTSQAEAQAPTTAVEDRRKSQWTHIGGEDRRVGAPAPAPAPKHAPNCGYWLDLNCSCGLEGDTP